MAQSTAEEHIFPKVSSIDTIKKLWMETCSVPWQTDPACRGYPFARSLTHRMAVSFYTDSGLLRTVAKWDDLRRIAPHQAAYFYPVIRLAWEMKPRGIKFPQDDFYDQVIELLKTRPNRQKETVSPEAVQKRIDDWLKNVAREHTKLRLAAAKKGAARTL